MEESYTYKIIENTSTKTISSINCELTKLFKCPGLGCDYVSTVNLYESNNEKTI